MMSGPRIARTNILSMNNSTCFITSSIPAVAANTAIVYKYVSVIAYAASGRVDVSA